MMKKWKFCFYPVWNFLKAERFLSDMERNGFYLEKRVLCYFFKFRKISPKNANYILVHSPVGEKMSSYDLEQGLKKDFSANVVIDAQFESPRIYRVCDTDKDLLSVKGERDRILQRECISKIGFSSFFILLFELIPVIFKNVVKNANPLVHLLFLPVAIYCIYNLLGYFIIRARLSNGKGNQCDQ